MAKGKSKKPGKTSSSDKKKKKKDKDKKKAGKAIAKHVPHNLTTQADHVAVAAYFKAERRGFEPGHELEDWLEAEAELE